MDHQMIAVVGLCGSGKSVVCDDIESRGYKKVYFGGFTMAELKRRGLDITPENEKTVREELRRQYGMGAYAILAQETINGHLETGQKVLIDGLYSFSEYKILQEQYGESMVVIAVFSPPAIRYQRLANRKHRPLTKEQAIARDYAEIENIEKGGPIAMADFTLVNDSKISNLKEKLANLPCF